MSKSKIQDALGKLDTSVDDHWTVDGLPAIGTLTDLVGGPVKRKDVTEAAPAFCRENPTFARQPLLSGENPKPTPAPSTKEAETEELAACRIKVDDLGAQMETLRLEREKTILRRDELILKLEPKGTITHAEAVAAHLKTQRELRAKRVAEMARLKELAPGMVSDKSPIDRAHARMKGRGMRRPVYPQVQRG